MKKLRVSGYDGELSEDVKARREELEAQKKWLEERRRRLVSGGEEDLAQTPIPAFSGNDEQDVQTIRAMRAYTDMNDEDFYNFLRNKWYPQDRTDWSLYSLIKKAGG